MRFYHNGKQFVPSGTSVLPKPDLMQWAADCAVDYVDTNARRFMIDCGYMTNKHLDSSFKIARTAYSRKGQEAADYGTFIHWMCEQYMRIGVPSGIPYRFTVTEDDGTTREIEIDRDLTIKFMNGFDYITPTGRKKHAHGFYDWCKTHKIKPIAIEHEVVGDWYGGRLDLVCEMDGVVTLIDYKTGKGTYYETWKHQLAGYRWLCNDWLIKGILSPESPKATPRTTAERKFALWALEEAAEGKISCMKINGLIQYHGVLKFNKDTGKINYKDFTEYSATRVKVDGKRIKGKVETEKYVRSWEMDWIVFKNYVRLWWARNGKEIDL